MMNERATNTPFSPEQHSSEQSTGNDNQKLVSQSIMKSNQCKRAVWGYVQEKQVWVVDGCWWRYCVWVQLYAYSTSDDIVVCIAAGN